MIEISLDSTKPTNVCMWVYFPKHEFRNKNSSIVKVEIYSKKASKKVIWKEMVIDTLGTKAGKIKTVIADGGFFAYQNYEDSPHHMIVPVIKPRKDLKDKTLKKIEKSQTSLLWWDERYASMREEILQ